METSACVSRDFFATAASTFERFERFLRPPSSSRTSRQANDEPSRSHYLSKINKEEWPKSGKPDGYVAIIGYPSNSTTETAPGRHLIGQRRPLPDPGHIFTGVCPILAIQLAKGTRFSCPLPDNGPKHMGSSTNSPHTRHPRFMFSAIDGDGLLPGRLSSRLTLACLSPSPSLTRTQPTKQKPHSAQQL